MSKALQCYTAGLVEIPGLSQPLTIVTKGIFPMSTPGEVIQRRAGPDAHVLQARELMIETNGDPLPLLIKALT